MAVSFPPSWYRQASAHGSTYAAMRDLIWYINGSHPTESNAITWACIDCYDGTTREQPSGGDMGNLSSGSLWKPGAVTALPVGAWVVLETPGNAAVANNFQVMGQAMIFGPFTWILMPYAGFTVGGPLTSSPTLPAATIGSPPSVNSGDGRFALAADRIYTIIMDEGMFLIRGDSPTTTVAWMYLGEVNPVTPEADDPRPFIFPIRTDIQGIRPGQSEFMRISIVDDVSIERCQPSMLLNVALDSVNAYNDLGVNYFSQALVWCIGAGSRFHIGNFRNIACCDETTGVITVRHTAGYSPTDYRFEVWGLSNTVPKLVTTWPPGTALAAHTTFSERSVPPSLVPATGGGGNVTPPDVTFVKPLPNSPIRSNTKITIDVTDDEGLFSGIQLRVQFNSARPKRATETIHGGDALGVFEPFYQNCTVTTIANGYRFFLTRVNPDPLGSDTGWPSTPTFVATPVDQAGNAA